jgi:hypothetical protein
LKISADIDDAVARVADELRRRALSLGASLDIDTHALLRTRASLLGFPNPGRTSANGHSRLLECSDQWIALTLARPGDVDVLEALTGEPVRVEPWANVARAASAARAGDFVARGRLLGLAIAVAARRPLEMNAAIEMSPRATSGTTSELRGLRVADLSSLWAGPLTAKILSDAGANVTKIESTSRPDGARARPEFYSTLHPPDQESLVVDFSQAHELEKLRRTLEAADVVIEASRPRALEQLGLGPEQVTRRAGSVWLSITGYGRRPPADGWVAFGDDAAAAGGLVTWSPEGEPHFVGDAIADPLTGLLGALGVVDSLTRGGGHLVDVSLQRSAALIATNAAGPFVEVR